jgi:3',5'-cyclic AMP phosphodiesterase CpdA
VRRGFHAAALLGLSVACAESAPPVVHVAPPSPSTQDDVHATSDAPVGTVAWQWYRDGRFVGDQTAAVLSADATLPGESWRVRCVRDEDGAVTVSDPVVIRSSEIDFGSPDVLDHRDPVGSDTADTAGGSLVPTGDLVSNGGFEDALSEWRVVEGECAVSAGRVELLPYGGAAFLFGGDGYPGDCLARQELDLVGLGADVGAIDLGGVAVDIEAMAATAEAEGAFGDQPRIRVTWLDEAGASLGRLETLAGSGLAWHVRGATGLVPPGARVAQLEVEARFRRVPDNDGMVDEVQLHLREVGAVDPAMTRQPMLQDHREDTMRLLWETDGNLCDHAVSWGPADGSLSERVEGVRTIEVDDGHYVHIAEIEGLQAGTAYQYRVESGATQSETFPFQTAPAAGEPASIAFLADNQDGYDRFATHIRHLSARSPDMVIVAGDVVQNIDVLSEWRDWWWQPLEEEDFSSSVPVMIARGNHDRHHPFAYAYTAMPEGEDFYSFRYGGAFIVVLDSQEPLSGGPHGLDQAIYLEEALASEAARTADFRVVVFHQAMYTNVSWGSASDGSVSQREAWLPIIEAGGTDLVVAGHFHSYQRGEVNGVTHVVVGGGGASLVQDPNQGIWSFMNVLERAWHYSVMEMDGPDLVWTTYDLEDAVIDQFTLTGGPVSAGR